MSGERNLAALLAAVKARLTQKRYAHSVAVQKRAAALAVCHGADWYRAAVGGLIHDICHCEPYGAQLKYLAAHGIMLDDFSMQHPQIWHAVTGAVYAKEVLEVKDTQILLAVRYHTTGRANMSALEKVVYLADATSADRDYQGVEKLSALAQRDLDAAMAHSLRHTVKKVLKNRQPLVKDAWEAYNYYAMREHAKGGEQPFLADGLPDKPV